MALYDLQCKSCHSEFQKIVSFSKLPEVTCPNCESNEHERVYKANIKGPVSSGSMGRSISTPVPRFT